MYKDKRVLLIGGGGTLGSYTARELLSQGAYVDIICLEDNISDNEKQRFFKGEATESYLREFLSDNRYDGIVNFVHYSKIEEYVPVHELLIDNTDHLIVLSSYRVYADMEHPITESAPRLLDVTEDRDFIENETYALPKARLEDFLNGEHRGEPWTIVRPVISFSKRRFDLFVYSNNDIKEQVERYGKLYMPEYARKLVAGIDWAGNSGKLIARLLFKEHTFGESYTVSTAQNLNWGEVADIYTELFGFEVEWCDEKTFIDSYPCLNTYKKWLYVYDRKYSREVDNSKILAATGLSSADFTSIADGLKIELFEKRKDEEK